MVCWYIWVDIQEIEGILAYRPWGTCSPACNTALTTPPAKTKKATRGPHLGPETEKITNKEKSGMKWNKRENICEIVIHFVVASWPPEQCNAMQTLIPKSQNLSSLKIGNPV